MTEGEVSEFKAHKDSLIKQLTRKAVGLIGRNKEVTTSSDTSPSSAELLSSPNQSSLPPAKEKDVVKVRLREQLPVYNRAHGTDLHLKGEPPEEIMTIEKATKTLTDIRGVDVQAIKDDTDLTMVGGHHYREVRNAMRTIAMDLIKEKPASDDPLQFQGIKKQTSQGEAKLSISGGNRIWLTLTPDQQRTHDNIMIDLHLEDFPNEELNLSGFRDLRNPRVDYKRYDYNTPIGTFQNQFRGVKWLASNLLTWKDPNTILPEDIDQKPKSSIAPEPKLLPDAPTSKQ